MSGLFDPENPADLQSSFEADGFSRMYAGVTVGFLLPKMNDVDSLERIRSSVIRDVLRWPKTGKPVWFVGTGERSPVKHAAIGQYICLSVSSSDPSQNVLFTHDPIGTMLKHCTYCINYGVDLGDRYSQGDPVQAKIIDRTIHFTQRERTELDTDGDNHYGRYTTDRDRLNRVHRVPYEGVREFQRIDLNPKYKV